MRGMKEKILNPCEKKIIEVERARWGERVRADGVRGDCRVVEPCSPLPSASISLRSGVAVGGDDDNLSFPIVDFWLSSGMPLDLKEDALLCESVILWFIGGVVSGTDVGISLLSPIRIAK